MNLLPGFSIAGLSLKMRRDVALIIYNIISFTYKLLQHEIKIVFIDMLQLFADGWIYPTAIYFKWEGEWKGYRVHHIKIY
jgi:hypothetical protein